MSAAFARAAQPNSGSRARPDWHNGDQGNQVVFPWWRIEKHEWADSKRDTSVAL